MTGHGCALLGSRQGRSRRGVNHETFKIFELALKLHDRSGHVLSFGRKLGLFFFKLTDLVQVGAKTCKTRQTHCLSCKDAKMPLTGAGDLISEL